MSEENVEIVRRRTAEAASPAYALGQPASASRRVRLSPVTGY
jgi:hypothetical protein